MLRAERGEKLSVGRYVMKGKYYLRWKASTMNTAPVTTSRRAMIPQLL